MAKHKIASKVYLIWPAHSMMEVMYIRATDPGCIGLVTLLACKAKGAGQIIVADLVDARLEKAKESLHIDRSAGYRGNCLRVNIPVAEHGFNL